MECYIKTTRMSCFIIFLTLYSCVWIDVGGTTDLHIGGLFPLSGGWFKSLGDECLKAAQLAVEHINNRSDILPGYNFKLDHNDTMVSTKCFFTCLIFTECILETQTHEVSREIVIEYSPACVCLCVCVVCVCVCVCQLETLTW